jgi:hypothetical protein
VYLFYFANDPEDTLLYLKDADDPDTIDDLAFKKYYDAFYKKKFIRTRQFLKRKSKIYYMLVQLKGNINRAKRRKANKSKGDLKGMDTPNFFMTLYAGEKTERQKKAVLKHDMFLARIAEYLRARKVPLTVVYIPQAQQISKDENVRGSQFFTEELKEITFNSTYHQDRLQRLSQVFQFDFIDLVPLFKEYKKNNPDMLLYNFSDGHFNSNGHQVVADILLKDIKSK